MTVQFSSDQAITNTTVFSVRAVPWRLEWNIDCDNGCFYDWIIRARDPETTEIIDTLVEEKSREGDYAGSLLVYTDPGEAYFEVLGPREGDGTWVIRIIENP